MSPRRNNKPAAPEVMTWAKALPVLAVSFVFDALRFLFEQFWFFGPALAAAYCTAQASGAVAKWTFGLLGAKTAAAACTAGAAVAGTFLSEALVAFGIVMAMAVGLFGWLVVGLILMMTNSRIFKQHPGHSLWLVSSLLISELPLIGSIPAFTITIIKLYRTQIRNDKEDMEKYEKENAAAQLQERQRQSAEIMHARNMQLMQAQEQEVIDEERYNEEAADEEIPDGVREAA